MSKHPREKVAEIFKLELEALSEAADVQAFVKKALELSPSSFWNDEEAVTHTKKTFAILKGMLDQDKVNAPIREVFLAGALLSDICVNEEVAAGTHNLLAIVELERIKEDINPNFYSAIVKIVNAHEGTVQIQGTEPKAGGPDHLVATANSIARIPSLSIS